MSGSKDLRDFRELEVKIPGPQGPLKGALMVPVRKDARAVVLINNATGVPARYYASFAKWLAGTQNLITLVWDYRDFGLSGEPERSRATLADWGVEDAAAARGWLRAQFPELPLWLIGHSLGGLALPFQPQLESLSRVITVAAGPVHLSDHPILHRVMVGSTWYGHGPLLTSLMGHFPGKRLGLGANIPGPAYWQWRRWCSRRGSALADPTMPPLAGSSLKAPVTLVAFADDALVPPGAVWWLAEWLPEAQVTRCLIRPQEHGLRRIGHVGAFSPRSRVVWPAIIGAQ